MITGLTKGVNLYLAPILSLTSIVLIVLAYLAPTLVLSTKVALLTITPSTALTEPTNINDSGINGPSVFLGALGSCSRSDNDDSVTCQSATVSPHYGKLRTHFYRTLSNTMLFRPFCSTFVSTLCRHRSNNHHSRLHCGFTCLYDPILHSFHSHLLSY